MRTDDPKLQVEPAKVPEAYQNSTLASRKAEREKAAKGAKADDTKKAVQSAENKAVKGSERK